MSEHVEDRKDKETHDEGKARTVLGALGPVTLPTIDRTMVTKSRAEILKLLDGHHNNTKSAHILNIYAFTV